MGLRYFPLWMCPRLPKRNCMPEGGRERWQPSSSFLLSVWNASIRPRKESSEQWWNVAPYLKGINLWNPRRARGRSSAEVTKDKDQGPSRGHVKQTEASAGLAASTSEAHICTPFCKHLLKGALVVETHIGVTSTEMSHRAFDSSLYSALYLPPSLELNFHSCFFTPGLVIL